MQRSEANVRPMMPWWAGGVGIGLILTVATAMMAPIGVSTQYVVVDAVLLHRVLPEVAVRSPYFHELIDEWTLATYEFFFVTGIPIRAFAASLLTRRFSTRPVPCLWQERFGSSPGTRLAWSFIGGFALLFGARFGGGCTSGHMISGTSQLAVSSWLFSSVLFMSAIATARLLYRDWSR